MSKKKFLSFLLCVALLINVSACKGNESYNVKDYCVYLANVSGISDSQNPLECINALIEFKVLDADVKNHLNDEVSFKVMNESVLKLMEIEDDDYLKNKKWVSSSIKEEDCIDKEKAQSVIEKAVDFINHPSFENKSEFTFTENVVESPNKVGDIYYDESEDTYYKIVSNEDEIICEEATFDEIFAKLDIQESYEIDFEESEIIPYLEETNTSYTNTKFELLSDKNHAFYKDGFRISYTILNSGITVHLSKEVDKQTVYADLSIKNVKPTIRYNSDDENLKNCFFSLSFNTTEQFGSTVGRYKKYHLNFKEKDTSSLKNYIHSIIEPNSSDIEATFKICRIKTKIPNVPMAYLNLDLIMNVYVNGDVKLYLSNYHQAGFETRDGKIRYINDHKNNWDGIISANAKATAGVNLNLEACKMILADIEIDGGLKASVKSTIHLYDDNGSKEEIDSDVPYSILNDIFENVRDIKSCGDVSLAWVFDIKLNTSKTKLYQLGFHREMNITDENDQVFHNLHHIEDGMFVSKCTRKPRSSKKEEFVVTNNKITLSSYAEVIVVNQTKDFEIVSLPDGYLLSDIVIENKDNEIISITNYSIRALKPGNTTVTIKTKDGKYSAYINVLVSTG